jgi:hypothetical protein
MSLIAWYPLDGNAEDYTVNKNHGTPTNVSWVNGKIGQAGSFGSNSELDSNYPVATLGVVKFSGACWVYPVSSTSNVGDIDNRIFTIRRASGSTLFSIGIRNYQLRTMVFNGTAHEYNDGSFLTQNTWHHISWVYINGVLKIYINGVLDIDFPIVADTTNYFGNVIIGNLQLSTTNRAFIGSINDFRLYDHVLSQKEINELAKAKVLHYNFNKEVDEKTTNLISKSGLDFTQYGSYPLLDRVVIDDSFGVYGKALKQTITDLSINSAARITFGNSTNIPTSGQAYISVFAKCDVGETAQIRPYVYTGYTWYIMIPLDGGVNYLTSEYRRFGTYATFGTASGGPTPAFSMTYWNTNRQVGQSTYWTNAQVEFKTYATPFTPTSRDGFLADNSGYKRHSMLESNAPVWTSGKLGSGSYYSPNTTSGIISNTFTTPPHITQSFWLFPTQTLSSGTQTYQNFVCETNDSLNIFYYKVGNYIQWKLIWPDNSSSYRTAISGDLIIPNQWNHIVGTFDGNLVKIYLNGELITTQNPPYTEIKQYTTQIHFFKENHSFTDGFEKGQIDDVRIYATALSDEEVLDLYQTRVKFDDIGNVYANELVETSTLNGSHYYLIRKYVFNQVHYYNLSNPFNLDDAKVPDNPDFILNVTGLGRSDNLEISHDGKIFYVGSSDDAKATKYTLTTPFDLSTATNPITITISGMTTGELTCFKFADNGKYFYINNGSGSIVQYSLATPYDVTSKTQISSLGGFASDGPSDPAFSPDGTKVIIGGRNTAFIKGGICTTPFDIGTFIQTHTYNTPQVDPASVKWNGNGTKFYTRHASPNMVLEFTVDTPYTLNGTTYIKQVFDNPDFAAGGHEFSYLSTNIRPNDKGQMIAHELNEVGIDTKFAELNNLSLREVFIDNQILINNTFDINSLNWYSSNIITWSDGFVKIGPTTSATAYIAQNITIINGNSYYMSASVKVDNSVDDLRIYLQPGGGFTSINNPTLDTWYLLSQVVTASTETNFRFLALNTSNNTINFFLDNTYLIDLTTLGINLTKEQMDYYFNLYRQLKLTTQQQRITKDTLVINGEFKEV